MIDYHKTNDEDLMNLFQKGDNFAFDELVKRYKQPLANFVYRFTSNYDDSLDIVQDTFVKVFNYKDHYQNVAKFSTWLYTIASNLAKTSIRRKKRFKLFSSNLFKNKDEDLEIEYPDNDIKPDENTDNKLRAELIQKALSKIALHYREVVILRDIMELSYDEISEITKLPKGTVKSRINRGRLYLKEYLIKFSKDF
jgi:RNA polymerase sigma-70 factor (ECF subfamily)